VRKHGKVDANQSEIVKALRQLGATVHSLASMGDGCPDLLVGFRQHTYLLEVKAEKGGLTEDQNNWIESWRGGNVYIVRNVEEALRAVGIMQHQTWGRKNA
jgi:hypothetical protein